MTTLDHSTGNPNAGPVHSSPEAVSAGRPIAAAPPGQVPYMDGRCGVTRNDGSICTNRKMDGWDVCLGHTPKKKATDDES